MRRIFPCVLALPAVVCVASGAAAQARSRSSAPQAGGTELGVDGQIAFGLTSPTTTTIALPLQRFRVAFSSSGTLSWEPWVGLNYISQSGSSITAADLGLGVLWTFAAQRGQPQWYVRPFLDLNHEGASFTGTSSSDTQVGLGAGLGLKAPVSDRLSTRWEANLGHWGASGSRGAQTQLGLLGGLSFFLQ